jgi:hypothetical protein
MFESYEQLLAEAQKITDNQPIEFRQALNYSIKNAVDPDIIELVNFITSEEVQFFTFLRS